MKSITFCQSYYDVDDFVIVYFIKSNGLSTRTEQENGYAYIVVKEDAHGTYYPVEYLTTKEIWDKYRLNLN